ncbi:IST1 homolog isoform X2 [Sesamum indicum]|uniref:IST1 homolog isoform X2 n=1 Tax=Sesamum indicum TaxID=4182 RepID=A0A6I9T005_SESIN|nr:IST1 homolog isoform X2 [Sesamum indicum]
MSVLNQLFNRGLLGAKCKTCLTLGISRIKLLQNKRDVHLKLMRKEIAEFLQTGQEAIARIRVEHVIREQNTWEVYEILELFCEFVLARVPILESQRECPTELQEAVASIIFAAPRCSDLPDLLHVRNLFAVKYGKEFIAAASELRPDTSVNRTIIEKLSVSAPPADVKLKVLKEIALEYNINWDSTKTETEFSKKPEDLLNGPKQLAEQPHAHSTPERREGASTVDNSAASLNGKKVDRYVQSPTSLGSNSVTPRIIGSSTREQNVEPITEIKSTSIQSSDVLQRARAAIAAAERASAAARAAAQLVNVRFNSFKLDEQKI